MKKKTILGFGAVLIILLMVSSSTAINITQTMNINDSILIFEKELIKPSSLDSGGWDWYKEFLSEQGIKIWARGYGTFESLIWDSDSYEFLVGQSEEDDFWKIRIELPETYEQAKKNSIKYSFYDENAESRMNSLIFRHPVLGLLLYAFTPKIFEKFRYNTKIPVEGTGYHEMFSWSYFFKGDISKGITCEGEIMEPIEIDTDNDGVYETYHYYEIRGRCGSTALKTKVNDGFTLLKYFSYFRQWQKDPDFFTWDD